MIRSASESSADRHEQSKWSTLLAHWLGKHWGELSTAQTETKSLESAKQQTCCHAFNANKKQ